MSRLSRLRAHAPIGAAVALVVAVALVIAMVGRPAADTPASPPVSSGDASVAGPAVAREVAPTTTALISTTVAAIASADPVVDDGVFDDAARGNAASPAVPRLTSGAVPIVAGSCGVVIYTPPTAAQAFTGNLCRPGAPSRDTAVLLIHGGGGLGGERDDFNQWRDAYLEAGYPTLSISYRLVDPATDNGVFPQPEANTKAAVQFLRSNAAELGVAPDQIVAHGASAGGRLAGIAFATPDDPLFGANERWPGVSDELNGFIGYYGYYSGWSFEPDAYFRAGVSPVANAVARAGGAQGSALIVHGDADGLIPVDLSRQYADALEQAGVDVSLVVVPGANHGFDGYGTETLSIAGSFEFVRVVDWLEARFS